MVKLYFLDFLDFWHFWHFWHFCSISAKISIFIDFYRFSRLFHSILRIFNFLMKITCMQFQLNHDVWTLLFRLLWLLDTELCNHLSKKSKISLNHVIFISYLFRTTFLMEICFFLNVKPSFLTSFKTLWFLSTQES